MGFAIVGAIAGAALGSLIGDPLWGAAIGFLIGLVCGQGENNAQRMPGYSEPHAKSTPGKIGAGCIVVLMVLLAFAAALVGAGIIGK